MELGQEKFTAYLLELQSLHSITNFYDYEKRFSEIHSKFGKEMLEMNISESSKNEDAAAYKKKFKPNLEKLK